MVLLRLNRSLKKLVGRCVVFCEIAEGTFTYRSLHSLTEQVEHQYHGRFLVELIHNAHDALFHLGDDDSLPARI